MVTADRKGVERRNVLHALHRLDHLPDLLLVQAAVVVVVEVLEDRAELALSDGLRTYQGQCAPGLSKIIFLAGVSFSAGQSRSFRSASSTACARKKKNRF